MAPPKRNYSIVSEGSTTQEDSQPAKKFSELGSSFFSKGSDTEYIGPSRQLSEDSVGLDDPGVKKELNSELIVRESWRLLGNGEAKSN